MGIRIALRVLFAGLLGFECDAVVPSSKVGDAARFSHQCFSEGFGLFGASG
jgi:hypothetical protein